jgi:energy-coupling factor transporter ATP-binding protein EcfA2
MTNDESHSAQPVPLPSRHSNPFATCWTKPGALAFRFPAGANAEQIVGRLAAQGWRGEIVGPHGSGKSTLLETLQPILSASGRQVTAITLRGRQRWLPRGFLRRALALPRPLVIIDGYEQLNWFARAWLQWRCRRSGAGLLVTSHASAGLPLLDRLDPDLDMIQHVVSKLTEHRPTRVTTADIIASHACRNSNVRELLFDLYERHEVYRRCEFARPAVRTGPTAVA